MDERPPQLHAHQKSRTPSPQTNHQCPRRTQRRTHSTQTPAPLRHPDHLGRKRRTHTAVARKKSLRPYLSTSPVEKMGSQVKSAVFPRSKGTTISSCWDLGFLVRESGSPVDAEHLADANLLGGTSELAAQQERRLSRSPGLKTCRVRFGEIPIWDMDTISPPHK